MSNKVDKGFELIYWNLSYRRKFIRTLWQAPLSLLLIVYIYFSGDNLIFNKIMPLILVIGYIWQILYTYRKWKTTEETAVVGE